jgi:hypothetical protein
MTSILTNEIYLNFTVIGNLDKLCLERNLDFNKIKQFLLNELGSEEFNFDEYDDEITDDIRKNLLAYRENNYLILRGRFITSYISRFISKAIKQGE